MNFCGIVCEFNPFHNGHEHIIFEAKKQTNLDVVCLMSGDFVQRGTPAIESKFNRAKKAISAGANAVLELPVLYACSNAENFAMGAIKIFKALEINKIAFGIENTSLEVLQKVAKLKHENSEKFKTAFKNEIQNGINYNTALKRSIAETLEDESILEVLNKPNNILAIEYLTAILKLDAKIEPIAIKRTDNGFNSDKNKGKFLSASAIREKIENNLPFEEFVPDYAKIIDCFNQSHSKVFDALNVLTLRQTSAEKLEKYYDYTEGIEHRIKSIADKYCTLEEIKNNVVTPRYRLARVNKLLVYPLLNITKEIYEKSNKCKPVVKVLAIEKNNKSLLTNHNKKKITLIASNKDYDNLTSVQKQIISLDLNASNIFNTIMKKTNNNDKKIGTMFL